MNDGELAGLILCGGASERMGSPKALLQWEGETFLGRLIRVFGTVCGEVTVVVGFGAEAVIEEAQRHSRASCVRNPFPEQGMLSSLQCGLRAIPSPGVLFSPVDYPAVSEGTLRAVARAFHTTEAPLAIPRFEGRRGHPVCLARDVIDAILALPREARASDAIRRFYAEAAFIDVADPGILRDVDTPQDYQALKDWTCAGA